MLTSRLDHWLTRLSARWHGPPADSALPTRRVDTPGGRVRVFDSGAGPQAVFLAPDGPNVIEHYAPLIRLLAPTVRVVCCDLPGFGHSLPSPHYTHSLNDGARAILAVLDALGIARATLAFSCTNGFYALRAAQAAPERIPRVILSQTPSMAAMQAWKRRVIPWPLTVPLVGQIAIWLVRQRSAAGWYDTALPRATPRLPYRDVTRRAFATGACWCLAGITQGLAREDVHTLRGIAVPCTLVWGSRDRSHRRTDPQSLRTLAPEAEIVRFADCGHFPDLEQPRRFAALVLARVAAAPPS